MRYALALSLTLAACFGMQSFALRTVGGRTVKSESNFFSSLGRIQAGAQGEVEVMVLGSSITGRLPDRAQGFAGVANMGCDGGSAVDALRAMDRGILPTAPWIVIEANTLHLALEEKPTEIGTAMQEPWFRAGLRAPCVSAYARPAAFFYSKLLARRTGGFGQIAPDDDLGVKTLPRQVAEDTGESLTSRQSALIHELAGIFGRLEAHGSRVLIAWLPPARGEASPSPPWILELARRSKTSWWDLAQEAAPGTVALTDGVHMAAPSAARTMVSLLKAVKQENAREEQGED